MKKIITVFILLFGFNGFSQLKVSGIFSDYMVLQREKPICIWGFHDKNEYIEVTFNKVTKTAKADKDGNWMVKFDPMKASYDPYSIYIKSKSEEIKIKDVLVGDVWLCSGQSNMEWPLIKTERAEEEIRTASDPYLRHFKIPRSFSKQPDKHLEKSQWEVASPATVNHFTAVGYYFAKNTRQTQDVPIGLINSTWGGSRIEAWMNAKTLNVKDIDEEIAKHLKILDKETEKFKMKFPFLKEENVDYSSTSWANQDLDTSDWIEINVPEFWDNQSYKNFDGVAWYRTEFTLSSQDIKAEIILHLAQIDDSDTVWINGKKVGGNSNSSKKKRIYKVNAEFLKEGKNSIAIKVKDNGGRGGIYGSKADFFIKTNQQNIPLPEIWKFKISLYKDPEMKVKQVPTLIYNKMIFPLVDYPVKGILWYQGESNAHSVKQAKAYEPLFKNMITQWRKDRKDKNLPFLWVQLANYRKTQEPNEISVWAHLRDSQSKALSLKNTAQAVIIDIGDPKDIHPKNKKDVGYRLSLGARKIAYLEDIEYSGPVYNSFKIKGDSIVIGFNHIGKGLRTPDKYGYIKGFTIAGKDGKFKWAKATIKDNKVFVWNESLSHPIFIRYAWSDNPEDANLYNSEGLPASPFHFKVTN
jgi:sialate O-acetylesterase